MRSPVPEKLTQSLGASVVVLLCIFAVGALQRPQLQKLTNQGITASPQTLQRQVETEREQLDVFKLLPAFGFDNLLANWIFLGFLQYFGDDEARALTAYGNSLNYFDVIIDRDPRFLEAYYFLSATGSIYTGMPEKTVALMNQGLKYLSPKVPPKSYYIWRLKAIDELLFLGDTKAARQSFETAAEWASAYNDEESQTLAAVSRRTANFIAQNPESKNAQVSAWSMVLNTAVDDRARRIAINRIRELGGDVSITPEGGVQIILPEED